MPELPEVETIRKGLETYVVGHSILAVQDLNNNTLKGNTRHIVGSRIISVKRYGKGLVIELDNGYTIAAHLKMTGQLIYRSPAIYNNPHTETLLPGKHTRVIFTLDRNAMIYFNDMRRFGWITILKANEIPTHPFFSRLGPEPLRDLTFEKFSTIIDSSRGPIKSVLLDQKKVSGIGNIYANDALFVAKIHPEKKAVLLTKTQRQMLFLAVEEVLKKGLCAGGASQWNYVTVLGTKGNYQHDLKVYSKQGQKCPRCGAIIQKFTLSNRGTYFCSTCQKL